MNTSNQIKIETFDKYIMRGGDQSLKNIEDLCDYGFDLCQLGYEPEVFNDVVIEVIQKLTGDLN
tara:strand:+ start:289 stop:480 length:192 start_codon:yes stop_codon:yes gene_type:complete